MEGQTSSLNDAVAPPLAEEEKLIKVLCDVSLDRLPKVLKCIDHWPFEAPAHMYNWLSVMTQFKRILQKTMEMYPDVLLTCNTQSKDRQLEDLEQCLFEQNKDVEAQSQAIEAVYQILRFLGILFASAVGKKLFDGMDLVVPYLKSRYERVIHAAVKAIAMRSLPVHSATREEEKKNGTVETQYAVKNGDLVRHYLLQLVQNENGGLDGMDFVHDLMQEADNESAEEFEAFVYQDYEATNETSTHKRKLATIQIPIPLAALYAHGNGSSRSERIASDVCQQLVTKYKIPSCHWFSLLTKLRFFRASKTRNSREIMILERLHAFLALVYTASTSKEVVAYVETHPEFIRSITELVRVEVHEKISLQVRIAALQVLTALAQDRSGSGRRASLLGKQANILTELGVVKGTPHGVFPSLIRFCTSEMGAITTHQARSPSYNAAQEDQKKSGRVYHVEGDTDMEMSLAVAFVQATTDELFPQEIDAISCVPFRDLSNPQDYKLSWLEAVFHLLNAIVTSQSGASVLTENGIVPALIHIISMPAVSPLHRTTTTLCVRALQAAIGNHTTASTLYRDLNGVGILIDRLAVDCASLCTCKSDLEFSSQPGTSSPLLTSSDSDSKRALIIALFRLLSTSFHTQGVMSAGSTSRAIREDSVLSRTMFRIFDHSMAIFGPSIYAEAATVVCDIINNDPSSVNIVHNSGLVKVIMATLTCWDLTQYNTPTMLPPSTKLVRVIPSLLHAITLTKECAAKIFHYEPLEHLIDLFTLPRYVLSPYKVIYSELARNVGSGIQQLMRQTSHFEKSAIPIWVRAIRKVIVFGDEEIKRSNNQDTAKKLCLAFYRMSNNVLDLFQSTLSKSDYAATFETNGGVLALLKLHRICAQRTQTSCMSIIPLLSGNATAEKAPTETGHVEAAYHLAIQSISSTLRIFGSQHPATLLDILLQQIYIELTDLERLQELIFQSTEAKVIFSSLTEVEWAKLLGKAKSETEHSAALQAVVEYLQALCTVGWLVKQLDWIVINAQSHIQSRRVFSTLSSRGKTEILMKLLALDKTMQMERSTLEYTQSLGEPSAERHDPQRIGSQLLLRFSVMVRQLFCDIGGSFMSSYQRQTSDTSTALAPHARDMSRFITQAIKKYSEWLSPAHSSDLQVYPEPARESMRLLWIAFFLETLCQLLFEGKREQANTLLLVQFMKQSVSSKAVQSQHCVSLMDQVFLFIQMCLTLDNAEVEGQNFDSKVKRSAFHIASTLLKRLSDLESLSSSPMTNTLFARDVGDRILDDLQLEPRSLTIQMHHACFKIAAHLWNHPKLPSIPSQRSIIDVVSIVVTILKNRLDDEHIEENEAEPSDILHLSRRASNLSTRANRGGFSGNINIVSSRSFPSSRRRRLQQRDSFQVDPTVVESLTEMGFSRHRVEQAIQSIELNDCDFALEWILSHPEEENEIKNEDSSEGNVLVEEKTPKKEEEQEMENELFESYKQLRAVFESKCIEILRAHQIREKNKTESYPCHSLVSAFAEHAETLFKRSPSDRQMMLQALVESVYEQLDAQDVDPRFTASILHLFVFILRFDLGSEAWLTFQSTQSQADLLIQKLLSHMEQRLNEEDPSLATILLVLDSLLDIKPKEQEILSKESQTRLLELSLSLLQRKVHTHVAHATILLLTKLLRSYSLACSFFAQNGVELVLSLHEEVLFNGYTQLATTLFSLVLGSPQVVEHLMEEAIRRAMLKLGSRFGSSNQTRITPRALLMEVAPSIHHNEEAFMMALQRTVVIKKSDSGRTYVTIKEKTEEGEEGKDAEGPGEQRPRKNSSTLALKLPKSYRQHLSTILHKIVERMQELWEREKVQELKHTLCVGTYFYMLTYLVSTYSIASPILAKIKVPTDKDSELENPPFLRVILGEMLPSSDLCAFAAVRKLIRNGTWKDEKYSGVFDQLPFLSPATRMRVKYAYLLLVNMSKHSSDGAKLVLSELVQLLQHWPAPYTRDSEACVSNDRALAALHAWAGLSMNILWPKGSTKSVAWEKVLTSGTPKKKYFFIWEIANALSKIDLLHPSAFAICTVALRPLATLTKPAMTRRISRLSKKKEERRDSTQAHELHDVTMDRESNRSVSFDEERDQHMLVSMTSLRDEDQLSSHSSAHTPEFQDVSMHSPAEHDHSSIESDESGESANFVIEGDHDDEEMDDEDGEDDEDDEDDDDEGDMDEDEDEDAEEEAQNQRIRLRLVRQPGNRRNYSRLWDSMEADTFAVEPTHGSEEEYSYLHLLAEESAFTEEIARTQTAENVSPEQPARSQEGSGIRPRGLAADRLIRSVFDLFEENGLARSENRDDTSANIHNELESFFGSIFGTGIQGRDQAFRELSPNDMSFLDFHGANPEEDPFFTPFDDAAVEQSAILLDPSRERARALHETVLSHPLLQSHQDHTQEVALRSPMPAASRNPQTTILRDLQDSNIRRGNEFMPSMRPQTRNRMGFMEMDVLSQYAPSAGSADVLRQLDEIRNLHRNADSNAGRRISGSSRQNIWGDRGSGSDIRALALRLEQRINDFIQSDDQNTENGETEQRDDSVAAAESSATVNTPAPAVPEDVAANETASETASVIALASTFGESSLRSPREPIHRQEAEPLVSAQGQSNDGAPASAGLLNFMLNLTTTHHPPNEGVAPAHLETAGGEEATATENVSCPEGMDPAVFQSLPPDMQMEVSEQFQPTEPDNAPQEDSTSAPAAPETVSQLDLDMENTSFDRETLEALPPDILEEVLANERREREAAASTSAQADVSHAQDMDNASFVASLAPDLREEILSTCDDAFLNTLPSDIRAEAMVLRERAVFRMAYRENDGRRTARAEQTRQHRDESADLFRRPTLRRMTTSNGSLLGSRRSSRRIFDDYRWQRRNVHRGRSNPNADSSNTCKTGMIQVQVDEEETAEELILSPNNVQSICRLVFMSDSIIQNHSYIRLLANSCLYTLTRRNIQKMLLHILTQPLREPLLPLDLISISHDHPKGAFVDSALSLSTSLSLRRNKSDDNLIPAEIICRMLQIFIALANHNLRFSMELLEAHNLHRCSVTMENESCVAVFIELLSTPVIHKHGLNLDLTLELIEIVLTPLRAHRKEEGIRISQVQEPIEETNDEQMHVEEEKKEEGDEEIWLQVPKVSLHSAHMDAVVEVLCMDICSTLMQERTVRIFRLLDSLPNNRELILDSVIAHASTLLTPDKYATTQLRRFESSAVLRSPQDELKLLRLLHSLSDICSSTVEFNTYCAKMPLDSLWTALSESLEEARERGGLEEQEVRSLSKNAQNVSHDMQATEEEDVVEGMVIEGKSAGASCAMAALLARFLPMVEAFFVTNARDAASMPVKAPDTTGREEETVAALRKGGFTSMDEKSLVSVSPKQQSSSALRDFRESTRLANFVEANRVLLNILVREKPSLLDSSLAALIKMPRCRAFLDFDNKRTYFQNAMKKIRQIALRSHGGSSSVRISVRRDHIFEDSYYALRMRSGEELRRKLHISFTGEEGIDAGGVTREWYMILAREIFNPNYVLFTSAADSPTFQPNPLSYVNKDHLSYFEFVGKVIGKAVADGQLLDAHFTRSFYKHMLQLPISYHDMEAIDPEYYRNLHSILEHPIASLGLELTFSAEQSNFGRLEIVDLIPNGRAVHVTDENKMEYVKLVTHHRMATGIQQQIDHFLKGFHQLISPDLISIFNENELELLISGMPDIDIDDLRANTDYANYKPTDSVIRWFWSVLSSFTHEERALFLQFVTGTSKVPLEGFKALEGMRGTQKFNIHKAFGNPDALPSAHTCFNQLDLPEYENEEKLKQRLLLAVREGSEGFGFG